MTIEQLRAEKQNNAIKAKELLTSEQPDIEGAEKLIEVNKNLDTQIKLLEEVEDIQVKSVDVKEIKVEPVIPTYLNEIPFTGTRQEKELKAYTFGKYIQGAIFKNENALKWLKEHGHLKANNEGTTTAGGFLTPDIVTPDLIMLRNEYGVVRRDARKIPMSSDVQVVPILSADATTQWGTENNANTPQDFTFANAGLTAKKLNVYNVFSTELRDDSLVDYASWAAKSMMYAIAKEEDRVFFKGNSTNATDGNIDGIFQSVYKVDATKANIASLVLAPAGSIATPGNLTIASYRSMVSKLPQYATNAKWYVSKGFFYTRMANLGDALSGNGIGDYANYWGPNPMFLGYPVVFVENLDTNLTANTPVLCLADLSVGCVLGDRMGIEVSVSDHVRFLEDSVVIRAKQRVAFNAFDKGDASGNTGALIVLAAQGT